MKSRSDVIDAVGRGELVRVEDLEEAIATVLEQLSEEKRAIASQAFAEIEQSPMASIFRKLKR